MHENILMLEVLRFVNAGPRLFTFDLIEDYTAEEMIYFTSLDEALIA